MSDTPIPETGGPIDKLKGKVKEVAGSVLGDDSLATQGKLEQAAAATSDEARQQAVEADHAEARAEVEGAVRANEVEAQRIEAQRIEAEQAARIEQEKERVEAQAERTHEQREAQVEQQAALEHQAAAGETVDAVRERAEAEQEAARLEAQAEAARGAAKYLDADPSS